MKERNWRDFNRANWDERVRLHLRSESYDLGPLRSGHGKLTPIEEREIGPVEGMRILHLQCHFGRDTLAFAQRGATVVGVDFSVPAVDAARALAEELGMTSRARFIVADLYEAPQAVDELFDIVFVNWGAINWLPDIHRWAEVVAHFLTPGGALYLVEGHPCAFVFDDTKRTPEGMPGYSYPYFHNQAFVIDDPHDYASAELLQNTTTYEWIHPLGEIVTSLLAAGLSLKWLHEHDSVAWRMFERLVKDSSGMYRWPDQPWFPLAFSLRAERLPG